MKVAIYDGDSLPYILSWICRDYLNDTDKIFRTIDVYLSNMLKLSNCTHFVGFLKAKYTSNYRRKIAVFNRYKSNRQQSLEYVTILPVVEQYLVSNWHFYMMELPIEVDDTVSIYANQLRGQNIDYVIVHYDKDLNVIPGQHLVWSAQAVTWGSFYVADEIGYLELETNYKMKVDEKGNFKEKKDSKVRGGGLKWLAFQMLTGDSTDCVLGVKGIGKMKAYKLLENINIKSELYQIVKDTYFNVYNSFEIIEKSFNVSFYNPQLNLFEDKLPLYINQFNVSLKTVVKDIIIESYHLLKLLNHYKNINLLTLYPMINYETTTFV